MLRYNQITTNHGKVIQRNSGRSKFNVEVNHILCTNRSTSTLQINDKEAFGNLQINYGVVGEQINLVGDSNNIQINYVDDCATDYSITKIISDNGINRYIICRNFNREVLNFSRTSALISYEISIIRCRHLSESTKKVQSNKVTYRICVEGYY